MTTAAQVLRWSSRAGPAVAPSVAGILLLWGAFTMRFPGILLLGYVACIIGTAERALVDFRMSAAGLLVLANFAFWLISGIGTGGVTWTDLLSPAFYNNDGRVFLYYLPLLLFACSVADHRELEAATHTVCAIVLTGLVLMVPWILTGSSWLSVGSQAWFGGLLTSHTGAGTFFGVLAAWLLVYGDALGSNRYRLLGALCALPMFASGSRQALVSLLAVMAWHVVRAGRGIVVLRTTAVAATLVGLAVVAVPKLADRTAVILSPDTYDAIVDVAGRSQWEPSVVAPLGGAESNILSRIALWKYAARRFSDSPILGVGFARYNDQGVRLRSAGFAAFAIDGARLTNVYNAHNMYLHVLAEGGLVGLTLLLAVWMCLWRDMTKGAQQTSGAAAAYFLAGRATLVFTAVSALFDNALASPSLGLPVLTLVGLGVAHNRSQRLKGLS